MLSYLKIKCVSLAAEAALIRKEERKHLRTARYCKIVDPNGQVPEVSDFHYQNYFGLHAHRVFDVRREARVAHLAYNFLRGMKYSDIENPPHNRTINPPNWQRVRELVRKYGPSNDENLMERFEEWRKATI